MKYSDPSEFFKFLIEKADIEVINDSQKCLAVALDLLDSEKPYFRLLKIGFIFNFYKGLIKAHNRDSKGKTLYINKAIKLFNEDCYIEKAVWAVGWLASVIYPNEWKSFSDKASLKEKKDDDKIIWEQPKPKNSNSFNKEPPIQKRTPIITSVDNNNINNRDANLNKWLC